MPALTAQQLFWLSFTTRTSSTLSLLSSFFILSTFLLLPRFRNPQTRLLFYATWGNLMTSSATLVSVSAVRDGGATITPLCRAQGALLQWGMLADPCWVFCVAVNVWWIVMGRGGQGRDTRSREPWYVALAYGVPAATAVGYVVHDCVRERGVIGPAVLWCWVRGEYGWLRIVFFYAPMWLLATAALGMHVCVGVRIYRVKTALRKAVEDSRLSPAPSSSGTMDDPFYTPKHKILVTTSIQHHINRTDPGSRSTTPETAQTWLSPSPSTRNPTPQPDAPHTTRSPTKPGHSLLTPQNPNSPHRHRAPLPIGKHRATAYAAPLASGDFATLPSPRVRVFQPAEHLAHTQHLHATAAAYAYFRVALLLFVSLVVVWGPSTVNQLYQMAYPGEAEGSYALHLASALVLPLQGFWNAGIYAQTTWGECKRVRAAVVAWCKGSACASSEQPLEDSVRDEAGRCVGDAQNVGTDFSFAAKSEPDSPALSV